MAKRFGDIENGGILKLALDNLNKYRAEAATRPSPQITGEGTPKNRIQVKVAVIPFYDEITTEMITAKTAYMTVPNGKAALESAENFAKSKAEGYYDPSPNDKSRPREKGFSPSRLRVFNPTSETAKYTKSKYTGLYYAKREGLGFSLAIGRKVAGDREEAVQKTIVGDLATELNAEPYRRVNFTDEKPPSA